jgi:mannose-6-phosphate isomerase-like protein (cupin superfamily)
MSTLRSNFFNEDILAFTLENNFYRKEICTGPHSQIVLMSIPAGQSIDKEIHKVDQLLFFAQGTGQAIINDIVSEIAPYRLVYVFAGAEHMIKNTGQEEMKLFTIYAPAQHQPGTIQRTKYEPEYINKHRHD